MLERVISALESEMNELGKSALKSPPDTNLEFNFGLRCGEYRGLQKALNVCKQISDEIEKAHEIRK